MVLLRFLRYPELMKRLFWTIQATHEIRKNRGGYVEAATLFEGAKQSLQLLKPFKPVLLGGFAISYYTDPRATQDFDLTISAESLAKIESVLNQDGFVKENSTDFKGVSIYHFKKEDFKLDLLVFDNKEFQKEIIKRATPQTFLEESLYVISPEDLIVTKLLSFRNKDKIDILSLLEQADLNLDFFRIKSATQQLKIFDRYSFIEEASLKSL